jgi:outer membrane protein
MRLRVLLLLMGLLSTSAVGGGSAAALPQTAESTLTSGSPAAADSVARPITLAEAVALAQENAPALVQALGQTRTSRAAVRSAYGSFIPSVSLSAGAGRQLPSAGGGTRIENGQVITLPNEPWSFNMGLGANVTLFDGGRRFFDLQQANARSSAAKVNESAARFAVTLAVKQSFFDVLAARESAAVAQAQLEQAEQQLRASIARVRARTATRSDSLRSDIQVRNARLAVMDARTSMETSNASLTRAVGASYLVTAADEDSLGLSRITLSDEALRKLAENAPLVKQAEEAVVAARAARRGAWTGYLPSLTAGYSRSGNDSEGHFDPWNDVYSYSGSLRFSLSFPLFNQLQREEQLTQTQVAEENAAAALRDARLAARESLAQSLGSFRSAEARIASLAATVGAAEEDLRVQQQRYAVGASTLLDVLTSQTQLDSAHRDLIRARYDQRVTKAQLEALVGQDL